MGGGPAGGRQQDRGDWGDRTERIERVNASGYPDQRPGGRGTGGPGPSGPGPSGPGVNGHGANGHGANGHGANGQSAAPGRGRADSGGWRTPDRREADRRETDRREAGRDAGGWTAPARGGASAWSGDDDPLTSQAYSRSAVTETDGRSYRVAARRSQAQTMLTEQTETFITGHYPTAHTGDYPTAAYQPAEQRTGEYRQYQPAEQQRTGEYRQHQPAEQQRTGEYRQYQGNAPATVSHPAVGHPGYGGQNGHSTPPARANGSPAGSGAGNWPAQPGGQYDAQQRPQAQPRQAASLPAAPLPAGPLSAPVPSGSAPGSKGGLNPYDVAITGSYPYPGQSQPAALPPAPAPQPTQAGADDPYYRPQHADGSGYGASYGNGYQDPRDRRY